MNLTVDDVKIFVPAKNFEESLNFYKEMGWGVNWVADQQDLAILELAGQRFYLQNYYNKDWANNFMMFITVEDPHAWYEHAQQVIAKGNYKYARLREPQTTDFNALVTYVWDPSGVLLHFAKFLDK